MSKWFAGPTPSDNGGAPSHPPAPRPTVADEEPIELSVTQPVPAHTPELARYEANPPPPPPPFTQFPYQEYDRSIHTPDHPRNNPEPTGIDNPPHGGPRRLESIQRKEFVIVVGKLCKKRMCWVLIVAFVMVIAVFIAGLVTVANAGSGRMEDAYPHTHNYDHVQGRATPTWEQAWVRVSSPTVSANKYYQRNLMTSTSTFTTPTPTPYPIPTLQTGTFNTTITLSSSTGTCSASTNPSSSSILQSCAVNLLFTFTIADGYNISTTQWTFPKPLALTERNGKVAYYSGKSVEKKYWHEGAPECEVTERAEMWIGGVGVVLSITYESTNACILQNGRVKDPPSQVCQCVYEGESTRSE
ncbi:hypothetical protein L873DRAFT_1813118 [Choiromyces venosus 120613-1]|uniref:Uncharacterized protein n=1 Tax=Choiromyces venosus 120613-1 TaxID=1336337 RepID=A0A3N4JMV1_9PEZI|nr:hypothetical protein L873DRAFT_1813118 [Choiromyces venosus 120613-1]